ncbi:hypothetical protein D3C78_1541970 [compost metagenome]
MVPTSSTWCQQRSHLAAADWATLSHRSSRSVATEPSGAVSATTTLALEVSSTKRSSSARAFRRAASSGLANRVSSACREPPIRFSPRATSSALFTSPRTVRISAQKSSLRVSPASRPNRPSYHSSVNTNSPRSPGSSAQISSAVKLMIGAIQRTMASAM